MSWGCWEKQIEPIPEENDDGVEVLLRADLEDQVEKGAGEGDDPVIAVLTESPFWHE